MVPSGSSSSQVYDVIVLGSGVIGATLAWKLAADGYRVCLCEERRGGSGIARAEHLPPQALELYRDLGIFERVKPLLFPLDYTAHFRNGHFIRVTADEAYAVSSERLAQTLRLGLEKVATMFWEPVVRVSAQGRVKSVRLQSGKVVCGWIVAVARDEGGGMMQLFPELREDVVWKDHSLSFSWNLELAEPERMRYPDLVFRSSRTSHAYEHLRIFQQGEWLRAHFFTFWETGDPRSRELAEGGAQAQAVLAGVVEGLPEYLGDFRVMGAVEAVPLSLTRVQGGAEAGVVLVGDSGGRVAPFFEMGLCKALHDIKILAELTPVWLRERQVTPEVIAQYYVHPAKQSHDEEIYSRSIHLRKMATDRSPEWLARRWKDDHLPGWLETACLRGVEGGRWTLENVGLPAWRKSLKLVQSYRESRRKGAARGRSGGLLAPCHDDLAGPDGFDDLVS